MPRRSVLILKTDLPLVRYLESIPVSERGEMLMARGRGCHRIIAWEPGVKVGSQRCSILTEEPRMCAINLAQPGAKCHIVFMVYRLHTACFLQARARTGCFG